MIEKRLAIKTKCKGHTFVMLGVRSREDLALVLALWCNKPQVDFGLQDANRVIDVLRENPVSSEFFRHN